MVCRCVRRTTITAYTTPAAPHTPSVNAVPASVGHGALSTAAISSAAPKWTIVGVAKAFVVLSLRPAPRLALSTITTNWRPINAADAEPTMT